MNKDEDVNLIALLKEALYFYANEDNYGQFTIENSLIDMDSGSQARFALETVENLIKTFDKIDNDYDKLINNAIKEGDNPENVLKIMNNIKNIGNED